jgi:hypothetical protein
MEPFGTKVAPLVREEIARRSVDLPPVLGDQHVHL